jgi:two-component sensor histidine kinase
LLNTIRILNLGTQFKVNSHELRKIRTTNLLNLVVILYLGISYTKYFILREFFNPWPSTIFLIFALLSLSLSYFRKTHAAFLTFTFNVNMCVCFFNLYYPFGAGAALFYFPLAVTVILMNNPKVKQSFSLMYPSMFLFFFLLNFVLDIPGLRMTGLSAEQTRFLWYYDLIMSVMVTLVLSFLLVRAIYDQNLEITRKNHNLLRTQHALKISLDEKQILLTEIQHRTKNNLTIITSLMNLQINSTGNSEVQQIISANKNRIHSMALVQKMLSTSENSSNINLAAYASELVNELFLTYNLSNNIIIQEKYDCVVVPASKSVPLGLIINEIATNSIKYAYRDNSKSSAVFSIDLKSLNANEAQLTVKDSGQGFPKDFNTHSDPQELSLGIFLIKTLAEQIDGRVKFSNENGARVDLSFNLA